MLRPVRNPPNPWEHTQVSWIGAPPETDLQVFEEEARSIISRNDSPDVDFTYSVNPYRGCTHACAYCYARPRHEYLGFGAGTDFETRLVVKTNAPQLLRSALLDDKWTGDLIAFSGDTDCYQPLEASYGLTRGCLEVCLEFQNPVGVITKSVLIRRDLDLLRALGERTDSRVTLSIAFHDAQASRLLEPGAAPPARRLEALRAIADTGIPVGVLVAPVIPGLNDSQIPAILEAAAAAGARTAGMLLLRLPGSVRPVFLDRLRAAFPDRAARVEARLRDLRGEDLTDPRFFHRHRGRGSYWAAVEGLFELHRRRLGLDGAPVAPRPTFRRPETQLELF